MAETPLPFALNLPILVFLMDPSICNVEVLEWWRKIVKVIEEEVIKKIGEGRKEIWVVEGGGNEENNPAAAVRRPVDKGTSTGRPWTGHQVSKGFGRGRRERIGWFQNGGYYEEMGILKVAKTNLYIGERGREWMAKMK